MRFEIKGRSVVQHSCYQIGLQGDNQVEVLEFLLPRIYGISSVQIAEQRIRIHCS